MNKITLVLALFTFSTPWAALAGYGPCAAQNKLVCSSIYSVEHHTKMAGPTGAALVTDIQPEPFDPAECEASVVLYTDAGKFVATYSETSQSLLAWIDSGTKEISFTQGTPMLPGKSLSFSTPYYAPGSVDSVVFDCSLVPVK